MGWWDDDLTCSNSSVEIAGLAWCATIESLSNINSHPEPPTSRKLMDCHRYSWIDNQTYLGILVGLLTRTLLKVYLPIGKNSSAISTKCKQRIWLVMGNLNVYHARDDYIVDRHLQDLVLRWCCIAPSMYDKIGWSIPHKKHTHVNIIEIFAPMKRSTLRGVHERLNDKR
jgi:hypothetical protein